MKSNRKYCNFSLTLSTSKKDNFLYDSDGNLLLVEILAQNPELRPSSLLSSLSFSLRSRYDNPIVTEGRLTDTLIVLAFGQPKKHIYFAY